MYNETLPLRRKSCGTAVKERYFANILNTQKDHEHERKSKSVTSVWRTPIPETIQVILNGVQGQSLLLGLLHQNIVPMLTPSGVMTDWNHSKQDWYGLDVIAFGMYTRGFDKSSILTNCSSRSLDSFTSPPPARKICLFFEFIFSCYFVIRLLFSARGLP